MCMHKPFIKAGNRCGECPVKDYGVVITSTSCYVIIYLSPRGTWRPGRSLIDRAYGDLRKWMHTAQHF